MKETIENHRKRIADIIDVRAGRDRAGRIYDFLYLFVIILNLTVSIMLTYENIRVRHAGLLLTLERGTVIIFCMDYFLRIWTARYQHPEVNETRAIRKYICSFTGIVDLLSFLPYFLPIFFPSGTVAFRMLRVMRVFRLFRINAYYDSFKLITDVLSSKSSSSFPLCSLF